MDRKKRLARGAAARVAIVGLLGLAALGGVACGTDSVKQKTTAQQTTSPPTSAYAPGIDPADFSTTIDNPFLPLRPGTRMIYQGQGETGQERTVIEVTRDTRTVMGVATVVVHDLVTVDGTTTEDTYDWYAQQRDGSVWYLGEDTKAYEDGKVSTKGSWEGGVAGALPGIAMPGQPQVGQKFRQEYSRGEAEDMGEVLSLTESITVPFGTFAGVVKTEDTTPLEPDLVEQKYYARGIGLVLGIDVAGGKDRTELVAVEQF
jgi:hypothetical protein